MTLYDLIKCKEYRSISSDAICNNQKLIEEPIYIFSGYSDASEDCYGPYLGDSDDYLYGIYENIRNNDRIEVSKKNMEEFEKDKIIIYSKKYVWAEEIKEIFEKEFKDLKIEQNNDIMEKQKDKALDAYCILSVFL